MTPMTPEERGAIADMLGDTNPAAPELVHDTLKANARAWLFPDSRTADAIRHKTTDALPPIVRRLLDTEQQLTDLRRILATAIVTADHLPDDGLTAGDLLILLTGSGLDLKHEIEHAEGMREADELAGVG